MEQEASVWDLIELDLFEKACLRADKEFLEKNSLTSLRNKVYALFNLEKYEDAVKLESDIISIDNESASDFVFMGIALWNLSRENEAIKTWEEAEKVPYQDASGGLDVLFLLYFASIQSGNKKFQIEILKRIKKKVKNKSNINWPEPIAHYLLDEMNEDELLNYISNVPILRERQLCQMDFVIGVKYLEKKDKYGYLKKLKDCISYGSNSYLQKFLYLAKSELKKNE
ncbi:hypothetical protein DU508_00040 [Pedobacter chinensis]|uniref:Uncharacterized protein n=1 Tax=Pedobacter chinensis TaxID=2282421 RepID=A0A369Q0M1_9SPHI|nr:hypothetical protein [Pedobacter chinensis]RDC58433.1 hypothetical protein DU508_00040 [Pedobacter chinensis]